MPHWKDTGAGHLGFLPRTPPLPGCRTPRRFPVQSPGSRSSASRYCPPRPAPRCPGSVPQLRYRQSCTAVGTRFPAPAAAQTSKCAPAAAPLSGPLCRTRVFSRLSLFYNFLPLSLFLNGNIISYGRANGNIFSLGMRKPPFEAEQGTIIKNHEETFSFNVYFSPSFLYGITLL